MLMYYHNQLLTLHMYCNSISSKSIPGDSLD